MSSNDKTANVYYIELNFSRWTLKDVLEIMKYKDNYEYMKYI